MSLSRKHHAELNKCASSPERFGELHRQYANDPEALRQIDIYDPNSEYKAIFRRYRDALKANDEEVQSGCEAWFQAQGYK